MKIGCQRTICRTSFPDGQHFLYRAGQGLGVGDIRVGSLDSSESRLLIQGASQATYSQGHVLFVRDLTLLAQAFNARRLELSGDPVPIAEQISTGSGGNSAFSVSPNGTLVYQGGSTPVSRLTWVDRAGKQLGVLGEDADWGDVQLSPDRTRAAVSAPAPSRTVRGLWIFDLTGGLKTRFTFADVDEIAPIWSPIDDRIVFGSNRKKGQGRLHDLFGRAASSVGREDTVLADSADKLPDSWSPDGRFILYRILGQNQDLWVLPLFGNAKPFPFANTQFPEGFGGFSPDGRWVAYLSSESGQLNVYVAPFPGPGKKIRISPAGAVTGSPRWRRDGKELFYLASDYQLMAAEVNTAGASFGVTAVRPLFNSHARTAIGNKFDISRGGSSVLPSTLASGDGGTGPSTPVDRSRQGA